MGEPQSWTEGQPIVKVRPCFSLKTKPNWLGHKFRQLLKYVQLGSSYFNSSFRFDLTEFPCMQILSYTLKCLIISCDTLLE